MNHKIENVFESIMNKWDKYQNGTINDIDFACGSISDLTTYLYSERDKAVERLEQLKDMSFLKKDYSDYDLR